MADSGARVLVVVIYVCFLTVANELLVLPVSFYGTFLLERRYGLSKQPLAAWVADLFKSVSVTLVLAAIAASILYFFMDRFAENWWLPAGAVFTLFIVGLAHIGPVLILPLFYSLKPIDRESLKLRLLALAEQAGARAFGAYEWGLGAKTRKANAALVGFGRTKRILVSDTMLSEYSDDEIEVVLAHEIAHHVHGDIWTGLLFESALMLGGFFAAETALRAGVGIAGLLGPADVAGLPHPDR